METTQWKKGGSMDIAAEIIEDLGKEWQLTLRWSDSLLGMSSQWRSNERSQGSKT